MNPNSTRCVDALVSAPLRPEARSPADYQPLSQGRVVQQHLEAVSQCTSVGVERQSKKEEEPQLQRHLELLKITGVFYVPCLLNAVVPSG
ncbi:MAG: hypothetical protein OXC07_12145 [Kistimonas sp.]|nr:hypothetical protein [Kistimonas sp.]